MDAILSATGITKTFGGTVALRDVDFALGRGEVHALVGENGAGKSTLLKVLAAVERRDRGDVRLDGRPFDPDNLRAAEAAGVALVFQETNVNRAVSVAENVFLNRLSAFSRLGLMDWRRLKREAQAILDELEADVSVEADIDTLDFGQLKLIEVARALSLNPKIVFFDESTAYLNNREMHALLRGIDRLRRGGIAVAFVSHHLQEVFDIADRVTVLKDGRWTGTYPVGDVDAPRLHQIMVGREIGEHLFPPVGGPSGAGVLRLSDVTFAGINRVPIGPFDFTLDAGRLIGIGGLKGSGGEGLLDGLMGLHPLVGGDITLNGSPYRPRSPADAWTRGVAFVPGERTGEGLIPDFSVGENLTLAVRPGRFGFTARRRNGALISEAIETLRIKTPTPATTAIELSGGNMQKIVLGKCLAATPRVLLLNNPTRGVDIGAKAEIYAQLRRLAATGMAVLMVTEDLPELIGLADQVVITKAGRVAKSFPVHSNPDEQEAVKWML